MLFFGESFREDQEKMPQPSRDKKRSYPIKDVVAVAGFPAEPAVDCLRHEFFDRIRDRYSIVFPPVVDYDQPTAFTSYRFETPDKGAAIFLSAESLGYANVDYEGFEGFKDAFLSLVNLLSITFNVSDLTRLALWYTNIIPFERKDNEIPLSRFLKLGLALPKGVSAKYLDVNIDFTIPAGNGFLEVAIEPRVKDLPDPEEAIFFTLKYETRQRIKVADVAKNLDEAHERTRDLFKSLINQTYWKSLKQKG